MLVYGEWSFGLNDIYGDGVMVVRFGFLGELSGGVCNFIYGDSFWGFWGICERVRVLELE